MHELSVCQALIQEVSESARSHGAEKVLRITVRIGPLSGVEPALLASAFLIGRAGTIARDAKLEIEPDPVRIKCLACDQESDATPNALLCLACGGWHTRLISGDALLLASVEMEINETVS
ncbi:MAG: hydrogenase maturation nickel metallochaperone HypA [Magnetococcales bacterium]|nr:hydrogenase maturation nickel metallochaperone HypA [Magnetococcales bacterium]